MTPFTELDLTFDVRHLKKWLEDCDLWGEYPQRCSPGSPHEKITDIWPRFKNPEECIRTGDWSSFAEEHESEWLKDIPGVKKICYDLMAYLEGSVLGGVLITKMNPGDDISPHVDSGWHAGYYDKYCVPIKNYPGAKFCFENNEIEPIEGEVIAFRNDVTHWVENNSNEDKIAMIICIRQNKLTKEGIPCLGDS